MKRDIILEKGKPYHIIARAVEGRTIFPHQEELNRFIVQMYAANYGTPPHMERSGVAKASEALLYGKELPLFLSVEKREPLVQMFSFVLVGNHYHLGLVGRFDNAISKYMQRLNTGFAKYFNIKHHRTGSLFETRFRAVSIESQRQLAVLLRYINIKNVLDVYQPGWHNYKSISFSHSNKFLLEYPFSSLPEMFALRRSYLIDSDLIEQISAGYYPKKKRELRGELRDVVRQRGVLEKSKDVCLE